MKRGTIVGMLVVGILAAGSQAGFAQPEGPPPRSLGAGPAGPGGPPEGDIARRVGTMRMWALTKDMDLAPEESAKLFPTLNKYDKQRAEVLKGVRGDWQALRELALAEKPDEKAVRALVDKLDAWQEKLVQIQKQERNEVASTLSPKRLAQFVLFSKGFELQLQRVIGEVFERRGPGAHSSRQPMGGRLHRRMPGGEDQGPPPPESPPERPGPDDGL